MVLMHGISGNGLIAIELRFVKEPIGKAGRGMIGILLTAANMLFCNVSICLGIIIHGL